MSASKMVELHTLIWGETVAVRADWSEASSPVYRLAEDDSWEPTGRQVADYQHSAEDALRDELEQLAIGSGDDDSLEDEIERAVGKARRRDAVSEAKGEAP